MPDSAVSEVLWQIKASAGYFDGSSVHDLRLAYGNVPSGYTQSSPSPNQTPQPLIPGKIYSYFAETTGAPAIGGYFYVDGSGGLNAVDFPDLCTTLTDGVTQEVDCRTHQPYQEPVDLEAYIHAHRLPR